MPFPSLYRAKAVTIGSGSVEAVVPQVFGETSITVTDALGALPTRVVMGWIFFQAGNPEFPVWSSGMGDDYDDTGFTFIQDEAPETAVVGETWFDTSTGISFVWTVDEGVDPEWVQFSVALPPGGTSGQILTKASATDYDLTWGEFATDQTGFTFLQEARPTANAPGDTWFNTATGASFVWVIDANSSQWVQFAPGTGSGLLPPMSLTTGFVAASGFTATNFFASLWGQMVSFRVDLERTGAALVGHATTGNITDIPIGTMPALMRGNSSMLQGFTCVNLPTLYGFVTATTGVLTATALQPAQSWGPGGTTIFIVTGVYMKDSA